MASPTSAGLLSGKGEAVVSSVNQEAAVGLTASPPSTAVLNSVGQTQTVNGEEPPTIFLAAQRGDLTQLTSLISSGAAHATDRDPQNITALHWAAINAHLHVCRYLLEQGADVDALGGDLIASPLQWAARNGYLYIIRLLIEWGADPNIRDAQGYNTLHLVTHSSSVMPLLYLLHQPINVDARDSQGHTALMWASYQGDAISVEVLLKHGAKVNVRDDSGLTPLHWAVVRGNRSVIRKLVEAGADVLARDGPQQEDGVNGAAAADGVSAPVATGRTPRDMAVELKSVGSWRRAMEEGGWDEWGVKRRRPLSERNTKIAIFILPLFTLLLVFTTLASLPWYTGVLVAAGEAFGGVHIVTRVLLAKPSYSSGGYEKDALNTTPYFAGIIFGSVIWVVWCWGTRLVNATYTEPHTTSHLIFFISATLCLYNFARAVWLDAGTCPRPRGEGEVRAIIEDLASEGRLNGQTFCVSCMARKPLRSKHCRICDKCCARHDHHCPWIWNCVGAKNHRQFVLFVLTLVIGIISFDYLTWEYFASLPAFSDPSSPPSSSSPSSPSISNPDISPSCLLPAPLCLATTSSSNAFLFSVTLWATLQLTWTIVLLATQLWQIARQMTTLEVSNLGRWGFMGGRGGTGLSGQMGHAHTHSRRGAGEGVGEGGALLDSPDSAGLSLNGHSHHAHGHGHRHRGLSVSTCCSAFCSLCTRWCPGGSFILQLTGLDRFTARGGAASGLALSATSSSMPGRAKNPFDLGWWGNCKDFWGMGREVGVEWDKCYDVPPEGFVEAKKKREREERGADAVDLDGHGGHGRKSSARGLFGMGISLPRIMGGSGSAARGQYEPLSQV